MLRPDSDNIPSHCVEARIRPIHDRLKGAGVKIIYWNRKGLKSSFENWERKFGYISKFVIMFANGKSLSVIDYDFAGRYSEVSWEIGSLECGISTWFPPRTCRETEDLTLWRFDGNDLEGCVQSFETLAKMFGK